MPQVTRTDSVSTYIDEHAATSNNKLHAVRYNHLWLQRALPGGPVGPDQGNSALVFFANPVPTGSYIHEAKLTLTVTSIRGASTGSASARLATKPWDPNTVTWATRPTTRDPGASAPVTGIQVGSKIILDVTNQVQLLADGALVNSGWLINTTDAVGFAVGCVGTAAPTLAISYSAEPDKPTKTSPGSGSESVYVSTPEPDLTVNTDLFKAGQSSNAIRVQLATNPAVASTGAFTTPVWSSDIQASSTGTFSLFNAPDNPVPAAGQGYYWIAQVRSAAGVWSKWSAPIRWLYQPQPVLTINSPSGDTDDSTPNIFWTFAGEQTQYRVRVDGTKSPGMTAVSNRWDSGLRTGDETAIQVPNNRALPIDWTYYAVVEVWDDLNRVAASSNNINYPAAATAVSTFNIVLTDTVAPVTNLRVSPQAKNLPYLELLFDRANAPDQFLIVRNAGESIDRTEYITEELDFVGGDTYRYRAYNVEPGVTDSWTVRSIVNRKMSTNNPTISVKRLSDILWLTDLTSDISIPITGPTPTSVEYTETGTTHDVMGSKYKVRITSALQARSGKVTGHINGYYLDDGTTTEDLRYRVLELRESMADRQMFLSIYGAACRVYVYNMTISPMYGAPYKHLFDISFDWHEVPD